MLKGYNIYLKPIEKNDLIKLYRVCNEEMVKVYNTIPNDIQETSNGLRKSLTIINERSDLIGFITYKKNEYYEGIYYIGITISSKYWGRGYGQDSIKTLLRYLFKELKAIKVELEVIKLNSRAINCYEKCGFVQESIKRNKIYKDGNYVDTIIMGIIKKELVYI